MDEELQELSLEEQYEEEMQARDNMGKYRIAFDLWVKQRETFNQFMKYLED